MPNRNSNRWDDMLNQAARGSNRIASKDNMNKTANAISKADSLVMRLYYLYTEYKQSFLPSPFKEMHFIAKALVTIILVIL